VVTSAYPVLSRHGVPFAIYLPTAFPDRLGEAWWLALEEMIARAPRISLVIDRKERRFVTETTAEKYQAYEFLASWMRTLPPPDLAFAIKDLFSAIRSISPVCRAAHRWTGTISQNSPRTPMSRSAAPR
jgi:peptidoglycan/xylan/chitin deacetylase (PgdA/CDA1 family)